MPRPNLNPTDEQRRLVKHLAAVGEPQIRIAKKVGIRSEKTLRKHYRDEIDFGLLEANANVGGALYQNAMRGKVDAQKFWLERRGGAAWNGSAQKQAPASPPPFLVACDGVVQNKKEPTSEAPVTQNKESLDLE